MIVKLGKVCRFGNFYFLVIFIEIYLLYIYLMLVCTVQQRESALHIRVSPLFLESLPI